MPISAIGAGLPVRSLGGAGNPQGSAASIQALEQKLARLSEEKKKALESQDEEKARKLEKQIEALKKQLEQLRLREKRRQEAGGAASPEKKGTGKE